MPVSNGVSFGRARRAVATGKGRGVRSAGDVALDASNELIPVLSGEMRDTGKVTTDGDRAAVAYTHPGAAVQHEALGYEHPGGGRAKFLEQAVTASRGEQAQALAGEIRKELS